MKNKILVTGGTGYIGSHTILELIRNTSYEIISADNFTNSSSDSLERVEKLTGKKVKNYKVDLCNLQETKKIFEENPDIGGIIHFAALKSVGDSVFNPIGYYKNNLESLLNILKCCEDFAVRTFIFSSSCSVYGNVTTLPVNESTPLSSVESPYSHTKLLGEEILKQLSIRKKLQIVALRYFNPVGADISGQLGESPINPPNNLVPVITQTAIGKIPKMKVFGSDYSTRDGSCIRDYIHVSDIAEAHIKAYNFAKDQNTEQLFEIFNLGTGNGVSVLEAIHAFEKESGVKLNYEIVERRAGDVESIYSDSTKAKNILGWVPKYGIKEMMSTAWAWQQNISISSNA